MVERRVFKQVGFTYVLDKLKVVTSFGRDELKGIKPFTSSEVKECKFALKQVHKLSLAFENKKDCEKDLVEILENFKDLRKTCNRLLEGFVLDDVELFELKNFSLTLKKLLLIYEGSNFEVENICFESLQDVIDLLNPNETIFSSFHIYDAYSDNLKKIRRKKLNVLETLNKEPENQIFKDQKTHLVLQESEEEFKVRKELSSKLMNYAQIMINNMWKIGKLDLIISKARLALDYETCLPEILKNGCVEIKGAYNLEVADSLNLQNKKFVGVDISLKEGVSILTGANMGGKTVVLSTVVLNMLLVSNAILPFAKEFRCCLVDFITFVSGDLQNKNRGISSFGAEVLEVSKLCKLMKKNKGLVVFDEFARSTNPLEGQMFVKALCNILSQSDCVGLISTHYDGVMVKNARYYRVIGLRDNLLKNIKSLKDDEEKINKLSEIMDYRIRMLCENEDAPKDAFKIASLLGAGDKFLNELEKLYQ